MHCEPTEPSVQIIGGSSLAAYRSLRLCITRDTSINVAYMICSRESKVTVVLGYRTAGLSTRIVLG